MINNPLSYILIKQNVINSVGLEELMSNKKSENIYDARMFDLDKVNKTKKEGGMKFDKKMRDTKIIQYNESQFFKIKFLFEQIVSKIINPFYSIEVMESEIPQLLFYDVGGHYGPHNDAEALWKSPSGELIWKKCADRDLSIIIFLNDDFEGGDLVFPELKIRIKPESGMMVCFPSNHHYIHFVDPVTKGERYSLVTWATVRGFPSKKEIDKKLSLKYGINVI